LLVSQAERTPPSDINQVSCQYCIKNGLQAIDFSSLSLALCLIPSQTECWRNLT
jgi:hypothetical protein